jgi:hypothetical protein
MASKVLSELAFFRSPKTAFGAGASHDVIQ